MPRDDLGATAGFCKVVRLPGTVIRLESDWSLLSYESKNTWRHPMRPTRARPSSRVWPTIHYFQNCSRGESFALWNARFWYRRHSPTLLILCFSSFLIFYFFVTAFFGCLLSCGTGNLIVDSAWLLLLAVSYRIFIYWVLLVFTKDTFMEDWERRGGYRSCYRGSIIIFEIM